MIRILKFAKKSWYIMIAIVLLLFVQAYCELALPQYTSNIVDVGIQYKGVENPVPKVIRSSTMQKFFLFLSDEEKMQIGEAYLYVEQGSVSSGEYRDYMNAYPVLSEEAIYVLKDTGLSEEEKEAHTEVLSEILVPVETMLLYMTSEGEEAAKFRETILSAMGIMLTADMDFFDVLNAMPAEYRMEMKNSMMEEMGSMSELMAESMAVSFIQGEYEAVGIELDKYQMSYLGKMGLSMLGLALLSMVAAVLVGYFSSRMAAKTSRDLRDRIFEKVVGFSNAEMNQFSTASLITRCTNDVQQVQQVLTMIFRIVAYAPIIGIGGIIKVLNTNSSMTWIIAVAVAAIMALVIFLMAIAMPKFKMMQKLIDRLNLVSREILTGIPVIRAFSREAHEEKRFEQASRDLMKTQLFTQRAMAFMMPTMMFIMNGITVLIIWVGAHGIDMGSLQVGDMMAFITYTMQIVMAFLMITMISIMLPRAAVAAGRIDEVLNSKTLITNPERPALVRKDAKGEVTFSHVNFRYPSADEDVLSDITFTAKAGETTAVIGSTGCGKSTLVQLIPRLFDVSEGSIQIDGTDIREMDMKELRQMIGYVPQKGILFSGTIESNLKFGSKEISDDKMAEAASVAQATEFINAMPEGYETSIAQGGTNVSGGQKQRLSIARAIAKEPKIYIFDDSFSALDYKTDVALRSALKEKVKDAVMIIVAQRISTILHAEKIIVLDDGKIAGMGTHEELLANNEVYRQIAMSQLSGKELEGRA